LVYRVREKDANNKPIIADDGGLGVRFGPDISVDAQGYALVNNKGMSVFRAWRDISLLRLPSRLIAGGRGDDDTYCFKMSDGPFVQGPLAAGLELLPEKRDPPKHGFVRPDQAVLLADYRANLVATQNDWEIDES
jgi:hypothetical protein